ncbi:MAG TPA: GNAT family N-acetyltransferase [Acidimicrobiia bacterium]|jgi:ribosomal protein S18 acetylase RimI-like enzyme
MVQVRPAGIADAPSIGRIHVESWQVAYDGVLPTDFLTGLSIASREEWWRRRLAIPIDRGAVLVVESEGEVRGFSSVGPSAGVEGEVYAIYLDPACFRRGLGRELMASSEAALRDHGFGEAVLWVLEANRRARSFYESVGWRADGAIKLEEIGGQQVTEVRYRRLV